MKILAWIIGLFVFVFLGGSAFAAGKDSLGAFVVVVGLLILAPGFFQMRKRAFQIGMEWGRGKSDRIDAMRR